MILKASKIALAETGYFPKLILDYIARVERLRSLYTYIPEIASFESAIEDKLKENINRPLLVKILKEQYSAIHNSEPQQAIIEQLSDKNTFTVCTGHQLCLFTGPLYFVYKILSTINLSETLKKHYPLYNFVPIYWMASEDHDFEEVQSVNLFGKKLVWNNPEVKGAVGKLSTASTKHVIEEFRQIAGDSETAKELVLLFENAYLKHTNLEEATRYLVHQLFAGYGLIIADGNDAVGQRCAHRRQAASPGIAGRYPRRG